MDVFPDPFGPATTISVGQSFLSVIEDSALGHPLETAANFEVPR